MNFNPLPTVLALLLSTTVAFASGYREESVESTNLAGAAYLFVLEDESGNSQRQPGIYARSTKGDWELVVSGRVQPTRTSPLVEEFPITGGLHKFESVAILDGYLTLFHIDSRPNQKSQAIQFGKDLIPFDFVTGTEFNVPRITNPKQVQTYPLPMTETLPDSGQIIIFSVASDPNWNGESIVDGVTFAVSVSVRTDDGGQLLESEATVLSSMAFPKSKLGYFVGAKTDSSRVTLISQFLLGAASRNYNNPSLPVFIRNWKKDVYEYRQSGFERPRNRRLIGTLPSFDPITLETTINSPPTNLIHKKSPYIQELGMVETMDDQGNPVALIYSSRDETPKRISDPQALIGLTTAFDRFDGDPSKEIFILGSQSAHNDTTNYGLFSIANNLYFYLDKAPLTRPIQISEFSTIPSKISASMYFDAKTESFFLAVSTQSKDESRTDLFRLDKAAGNSVYLAWRHDKVSDEFYEGQSLDLRLQKPNEHVLFDSVVADEDYDFESTPIGRLPHVASAPWIDLSESSQSNIQYMYKEPEFEFPLFAPQSLRDAKTAKTQTAYRTYSPDYREILNPDDLNGIYQPVFNSKKQDLVYPDTPTFPGELVQSPVGNKDYPYSFSRIQFDWKSIQESQKEGKKKKSSDEFLPKVIADIMELKAPGGATQHILSLESDAPKRYKAISLGTVKSGSEQVQFEFARSDSPSTGIVVLRRSTDKDGRVTVAILRYDIKEFGKDSDQIPSSKISEKKFYADPGSEVATAPLSDLLLYTGRGRPYFVVTPHLERYNEEFEVFDVVSESTKRNPSGTGLNLKSEAELALDDSDKKSVFNPAARWVIHPRDLSDPTDKKDRDKRVELAKAFGNSAPPFGLSTFPTLRSAIEDASNTNTQNRHMVFLVPDDLKAMVLSLLVRALDSNDKYGWSIKNPGLAVSFFGDRNESSKEENVDKMGQEELNEYIRLQSYTQGRAKPVMISDANLLLKVGNPEAGEEGRKISVAKSDDNEKENDGSAAAALMGEDDQDEKVNPHVLYLLATEGRADLPIERINHPKSHEATHMVVASETEWENLKASAQNEFEFGLGEHFELVDLGAPSKAEQIRLLKELLDRPDIAIYNFDVSLEKIRAHSEGLNREQKLNALLDYFVARVESLAEQKEMNRLLAFSNSMGRLAQTIKTDKNFRADPVLNRKLIESVFTKVFGLPLNLRLLPPNDPLRQIQLPNFVSRMQTEGEYPGSTDLIRRITDTMQTQTQPQSTKPIPETVILYGPTSTGKTTMFTSLIKTLDIPLYDWKREPSDEVNLNAGAIVLDCSKLTDEEQKDKSGTSSGHIHVDEAIRILEHLLAQPQGYRLKMLFDDLHFAPDGVKAKLITWIRMTINSEGGVRSVKSAFTEDAETETIPVRNLGVWISLNGPDDKDKAKKFADPINPKPEQLALAGLSGTKVQVDASFFARFALFLDVNGFRTEAKGPGLMQKLNKNLHQLFDNGLLGTVSPILLDQIVGASGSMHGRDFLAGGVNGVLKILESAQGVSSEHDEHAALIVVPKSTEAPSEVIKSEKNIADQVRSGEQKVSDFIINNAVAVNVATSREGQLHLLSVMVNRFRSQLITAFSSNLQSDPRMASETSQYSVVGPIEQALYDHIKDTPSLPLRALALSAERFGERGREAQDKLNSIIELVSGQAVSAEASFFPDIFANSSGKRDLLDRYSMNGNTSSRYDRRGFVNIRTARDIQGRHRGLLARMLFTDQFIDKDGDEVDQWFSKVKAVSTKEQSKIVREALLAETKHLVDDLISYFVAINNKGTLEELQSHEGFGPNPSNFNIYESTRLFLTILDKAITMSPWERVAKMMSFVMSKSVQSLDLSESSEVRNVFFGRTSLILPDDLNHVLDALVNSKVRKSISDDQHKLLLEGYGRCESLIMGDD